jgi:hypothetical protein
VQIARQCEPQRLDVDVRVHEISRKRRRSVSWIQAKQSRDDLPSRLINCR